MKAQSEMIGLMIIIILLIFIGLVFLRFSMGKDSNLGELRTNIQASNLLSTILRYSYEDGDVKDLIVKCASRDECSEAQNEVKGILENSLDNRTRYEFKAVSEGKEVLKIGDCNIGVASNMPISESGLFIEVGLKLCRSN